MTGRKLRIALVAFGASVSLFGAPSESKAIFDLFGHHHCNSCPTPSYMPISPAPACAACQQACNYVPQTCYRTVYMPVPVTACQPVTTCDPCTGCPTTVMRPITTYMQQARVVPYTTYRPVMSNACGYNPMGGCATGACGSPMAASYAPASYAPASYAPAPGCSSCAAPSYGMAPGVPGSTVPSLSASLSPVAQPTQVMPMPGTLPNSLPPAAPVQIQQNSTGRAPATIITPPRLLDRMTARPIYQASPYKMIAVPAAPRPAVQGGWHPAR